MSKITKEQAQSVSDLKAGYTLGHADVAILNELARIALASLEAEPVAYIIQDKTDRKEGHRGELSFRSVEQYYEEDINEHELTATPLYTAPPAPVSVPDEKVKGDDFELNGPLSCYQAGKIDGWNEFRAAMLKEENATKWWHGLYNEIKGRGQHHEGDFAPDLSMSTEEIIDAINKHRDAMLQGAEPVTTAYKLPEGYALVPVEPTYQMCEAMGLPWESLRFPDRYKAMIAAAPQQEVKP